MKPLADRIRPMNISEVVGQEHLLSEGKILRRIIDKKESVNMIFYGPSGVGKSTIANIVAKNSNKKLYYLNATTAGAADIKKVVDDIKNNPNGILLYLDEIQYFNKKQQQILLSYIENGDITLIAATTENPFFYVYPAILSRTMAFEFKTLSVQNIETVIDRCVDILSKDNGKIIISDVGKHMIAQAVSGDVRKAINMIECAVIASEKEGIVEITDDTIQELLKSNGLRYDKDGDQHYDIISAYQKSMRGSDPDAALFQQQVTLQARAEDSLFVQMKMLAWLIQILYLSLKLLLIRP